MKVKTSVVVQSNDKIYDGHAWARLLLLLHLITFRPILTVLFVTHIFQGKSVSKLAFALGFLLVKGQNKIHNTRT